MKEQFLNSKEDCKWLRETHLKDKNLNNELPFEIKSFVIYGNEDCPDRILIYPTINPTVTDLRYKVAHLMDNGKYSILSS